MKYNKKIPAFTLSEVLIVLVITAIVIGIAFSVLTLVNKQYNAIRDSYTYKTAVLKLKQQLLVDFNQSQSIQWKADEGILIIESDAYNAITYEWNTAHTVRNTDTTEVGIKDVIFFRDGKDILGGYIDGLKLECTSKGRDTYLFVAREPDAQYSLQGLWD
jgi:type II secretory pathway component PulJ